jgi:asparagine synthase (glutamine-hydrolysing)
VKRAVDIEALDSYLAFGTVPAPRTIFQDIFQLPPAHALTFRDGTLRLREYWDTTYPDEPRRSETEYLEEFQALLEDAVRARLVSDVPLGAFLSGGVDSSLVVAMMAQVSEIPVRSETAGFREPEWDESRYADAVARRLETDHRTVVVAPRAVEVVPRLVWHFDEPFADSSAIPTYYVCRAARERVTVALSGDGGDELFGGYQRRYGMMLLEARLRPWVPGWVRRRVLGPLAARYPKWDWLPRALRLKYFLSNLSMPLEHAYFHDMSFLFRPESKARLYSDGLRGALMGHDPSALFERLFQRVRGKDLLSQVLYVDLKTSLPNDMLAKVDRMSMANSLEVRCPLLDHSLIEFAARVPSDLNYRGRTSKYLLKRYLERMLPRELVYRPKMGFSVPLARWLRGELRPLAEELLFSRMATGRGYFEPAAVQALWRAHCRGIRDHSPQLWGLMVLELWHRTFVDRFPDGPVGI